MSTPSKPAKPAPPRPSSTGPKFAPSDEVVADATTGEVYLEKPQVTPEKSRKPMGFLGGVILGSLLTTGGVLLGAILAIVGVAAGGV